MIVLIYTIGYEGATVDSFIQALVDAGIETLVDVRALPLSRKKGFSKRPLSGALANAGLGYLHCGELGNPREGREAARSGDLNGFFRIYKRHFLDADVQVMFKKLVSLANERVLCMMCFERNPNECHRSIIAEHMKGQGLAVQNLFVRDLPSHERQAKTLRDSASSEGLTTAE
jgi:uncharacterized protein (DUF488 family)